MEPGSLIMERKMLIAIKQRAERLHAEDERLPLLTPGAMAVTDMRLSTSDSI
jgi:hypothetical protein